MQLIMTMAVSIFWSQNERHSLSNGHIQMRLNPHTVYHMHKNTSHSNRWISVEQTSKTVESMCWIQRTVWIKTARTYSVGPRRATEISFFSVVSQLLHFGLNKSVISSQSGFLANSLLSLFMRIIYSVNSVSASYFVFSVFFFSLFLQRRFSFRLQIFVVTLEEFSGGLDDKMK